MKTPIPGADWKKWANELIAVLRRGVPDNLDTLLAKPGMIVAMPLNSTVPPGWLLCDAATYPIALYPALADTLVSTWSGGNFTVPDGDTISASFNWIIKV